MKRANPTASLVILLLTAACTRPAPTLGPASEADVTAVATIVASLDSCARTGALDVFVSHSTDDVVMLAPDQPAVIGKTAVREVYKNIFATLVLDMRHEPLETHSMGDLVISRGSARGTGTPRAGGASAAFDNKFLMLFRRQPDGALKIWRVAFNTNAPPAQPAATSSAAPKK